MDAKKENDKIFIELSHHEAIVFCDWLFRFNKLGDCLKFEDQAEERILWDMEAVLEKNIDSIFSSNHKKLLHKARELIRDK